MSRLTGKEAFGLMEAYQAVYAPRELTEEQVWEGVENWVHSLLEEGYDLSDYTWEEMYEGYITELMKDSPQYDPRFNVPQPKSSSNPVFDFLNAPNVRQNATNAARTGMYGRYGTPSAQVKVAPVPNFDTDKNARDRYGLPPKKSTTPTPARPAAPTPARPAAPAPAPRPAAIAPAPSSKPAAAKTTTPDSKMGGDPMDQWARANPTLAAKVKPGQSGYNTIRTRLDADNDRQENYDAYDLVLSHLINEGYADTQEAALAIMGNMSEEWLGNIMEKKYEPDEELPGSGLTPSRKYRIKRKEFLKHSKDSYQGPYAGLATKSGVRIHPDDPKETGRTRAHRMTSNYNSSKNESYDLYNVILSHLLDEGYADTQEAALAIMGNMSEEWSQSIISEGPNYDKNRQRAAKRAAERNEARKRGQTGNVPGIGYVSPRPERETYRDAAGVERHTSGARMPKKDEGDK